MIFVILLWLEWLEYLSIFLTVIGLIISISSQSNNLLFIAIVITFILNIINRFRLENRSKNRIAGALNIQLKRFSESIEEINIKIEQYIEKQNTLTSPPKISNIQKSENKIIASLQEDVESLNKSLTSIIDYIQEYKLEPRIKNLEQLYQSSQSSRKPINSSGNNIKLPDQNILIQSQTYDIEPPPKIGWKCIHIINAHSQSVTDLVITHDSKYLLSTSWDQYLKIWSLVNGNEIDSIKASDQGILTVAVNKIDYFDCGIATGSLDQDVKIWSLKLEKNSLKFILKHNLTQHTGSIHGLEIASSHKIVISGSYDQTVKQWDLRNGDLLYSDFDETGAINAVAIHEEGEFIATGGGDGEITLWKLGDNKKLGVLVGNVTSLESIAISTSGEYIAGGCADGSIKIWHLPTTTFNLFLEIEHTLELHGHHGPVMDLIFNPDGKLLYSGGADGLVKIWHPSTGKELGHLKIIDDNRIFSLSLSKNGEILAAGGVDGTIKIWQQTTSN
ncbi:MAG: WD40 repeat domain-containing protein [Cyanobacteria bacterium]|nr:WD40 repeat domain-containing protein [Cyanobacteria bacterium CG_2015-16_32_12]NCO79603.1 WD40 repeat domain-containing protein [Cyanobacteria bacterium CG_2015-22_32_23]NCQ03518.1 WD40 repeat domain-containing protein [Cyanobacteria bacterium CG_2015-09_32_10]NCQ40836.1 WD40 repeat domain-containing protein [Cyanobacteria bacterium CG_2015-04_32_10]NCS85527.1 WD40 repeat domain-containing protein [Cyanobacteria bacterium CG_2015-02_32_10]